MPRITLSAKQIQMLSSALNIAAEDGSIYGAAYKPEDYKPINAQIEAVQKKLSRALSPPSPDKEP